jgi:hypothetical protein
MTTSVDTPNSDQVHADSEPISRESLLHRLRRTPVIRELLIIVAFCGLTSLMTWPYVGQLRSAVVGPGDPYLIAWTMWWDFHQTFTDPINLFHANTFYPYPYSLAFSETCYGLSLLFFPFYAIGLKPLTVHAIGMFLGFALSGYGAFRLMRTLNGCIGAAWVAGILFAFIPYRFNLMAQLMYHFSMWLPLLFEALILFARGRTWKRAAWLGVAFFMTGLTTITWLLLALIPFALIAIVLLTRYEIWSDRRFWFRSAVTLGAAGVALLPFTIPFVIVSKMYGFKRGIPDVAAHSASPYHWLVAEGRSKIWSGMGDSLHEAWKFQLFPGLLALLFPLSELVLGRKSETAFQARASAARENLVRFLDIVAVIALTLLVPALGYTYSKTPGLLFTWYLKPDYLFALLGICLFLRILIAYPKFLRRGNVSLLETIRNTRDDSFWVAICLVVIGFLYSIGWNTFFYRLLYEFMPGFKSIRAPMRGSMFAYLGLSILAGLGVHRLAVVVRNRFPQFRHALVYGAACLLLVGELNGSPLYFIHGDVDPDAVSLRLKTTPMRGGITYFPAGIDYNQRYMLRAADHAKPLILGTSGFSPPYVTEIEKMTAAGPIPAALMDLFEKIPASYLVVENSLMREERKQDFRNFLIKMVSAGRLRYINSFTGNAELYAVVSTEPETKTEAPLPESLAIRFWPDAIDSEPTLLLAQTLDWGQRLFRLEVASKGSWPRYKDFISDFKRIGEGVVVGSDEQEDRFRQNFQKLLDDWVTAKTARLDDTTFVTQLVNNAGLDMNTTGKQLLERLASGNENRVSVLQKVLEDPAFVERENYPSLVVLYYFCYLRRNPDDPPDGDLRGYNFWLDDLKRNNDPGKLTTAFKITGEYLHPKKTQ